MRFMIYRDGHIIRYGQCDRLPGLNRSRPSPFRLENGLASRRAADPDAFSPLPWSLSNPVGIHGFFWFGN